jgi:hypothetical protein
LNAKLSHLENDIAQQVNKQAALVSQQEKTEAQKVAAIDVAGTQKLTEAKNANESLRTGVAAGTVGLRVAARCPTPTAMPSAPENSSVGNGASPALTPAAESAYFTLRTAIDSTEAKLTACQALLKN